MVEPKKGKSRVKPGVNDLETLYPRVAAEWDYDANGDLTPSMVTAHSAKKVGWICEKGHRWQAKVYNRTSSGSNCPFCTGKKPIVGETDLATLYPDIAEQWDYSANGDLTPSMVTAHSAKKVGWICEKGHRWQATVNSRTSSGAGCPFCTGKKPIVGETDLATLYPDIAEQWDYNVNGDLTPSMVTAGSTKKVGWKCEKCHQWRTKIYSRTNGNSGCPYCSRGKPIAGENDLATLYPDIAEQWDYSANGDLTPSMVMPHSEKKVGWICEKGHRWQATVYNRTSNGTGCPCCTGHKVIVGETDLATLYPDIAEQWDYNANGDLTPSMVAAHSDIKAWWKCEKEHFWRASIANRTLGSKCPYCQGTRKWVPPEVA